MNTVSVLVRFGFQNPEYMNVVWNLFSGSVQYRSCDMIKRKSRKKNEWGKVYIHITFAFRRKWWC